MSVRTVFKYELPANGAILMPEGADPLCVQVQRGEPFIWAKVDPAAPLVLRIFRVVGTGDHLANDAGRYLGTFQVSNGALVFHVFESSPPPHPLHCPQCQGEMR